MAGTKVSCSKFAGGFERLAYLTFKGMSSIKVVASGNGFEAVYVPAGMMVEKVTTSSPEASPNI